MYKIKDCSKCDSDNWIQYLVSGPLPEDMAHYIECGNCGTHTRMYDNALAAVKAWNDGNVQEEEE